MNDKIKALMVKSGLSEEAASGLCEAVERHLSERYARMDAEFNAKLSRAKKVCVEEVEAHKRELARRMQIFCEAKGQTIEATIAKQTAIKESAAYAKLKDIRALLEGVELNGGQNGALQAEVTELKRRVTKLQEERNSTNEKANRAYAIAEKVLKRNRVLESKLATAKAVSEGKTSTPAKPIHKTGGRPVSTHPTLVEHQDRQTAAKPQGIDPAAIAALLD